MKPAPAMSTASQPEVEKKCINQELWQACAGPLVNLPAAGTHVVYFPQGHSEQVAASLKMNVDGQIPTYPNLPSKLLCLLHNVTLHADPETDEVYAQMTLQPVTSFDKEALLRSDLSVRVHKPQTEFFCKTLTASDTSTHGGFSVPRRAAEKIFPPLDYSMQPPAQELVARDLHDNVWTFRHIYRGQPKRHLLTTGWSLIVSGKRLFAGDSVLFIRDSKQHLLLGTRRANRQPTNISSSVLSTDSMHIGILAAAAYASANNSPFTVFYNPRTSPSEFVIPLAKYYKANYGQQVSLGMRFRMMFETEESGTRRYMGTISGISDLDPRWKNSQWRNLQVDWDESTGGERPTRVSVWEIEPVLAPFFMCPPPILRAKRPRLPGMPDDDCDFESLFKRTMPWLGDDPQSAKCFNLLQSMNMQQSNPMHSNFLNTLSTSTLQSPPATDLSRQLGFSVPQNPQQTNMSFTTQGPAHVIQRHDQVQKSPVALTPLSSLMPSQQHLDISQHATFMNPTITVSQVQSQLLQAQAQAHSQNLNSPQQPFSLLAQAQAQAQAQVENINNSLQQTSSLQAQAQSQAQVSDSQLQMQVLQRMQQQQSLLYQHSTPQQDMYQNFSRSLPNTQMLDNLPQTQMMPLPDTQIMSQMMSKSNYQPNLPFSQLSHIPKIEAHQPVMAVQEGLTTNHLPSHPSTSGSGTLTALAAAGQSAVANDITSSSTSHSTNNSPNIAPAITNSRMQKGNSIGEGFNRKSSFETMSSHKLIKELDQTADVKPPVNVVKVQSQGHMPQKTHQSLQSSQIDYLDSSSATSVSITQNDIMSQCDPLSNLPSFFLPDAGHDVEVQADPRNTIHAATDISGHHVETSLISNAMLMKNIPGGPNKKYSNNAPSGFMPSNYENGKDGQQELSSSMVTQSFGVPDMVFNSRGSAVSDGSYMNSGAWGAPPQYQRLRTYTKVYKRGAVGRSIDVTRYSNYDELKQDVARMFGIEGQLEDRGRAGWKLVYVDHENDVLLLGDDPWEDFMNCVRCIKILSPQEVQQMSLEGDFGNASMPKQDCSSSDGG